MSYSRTSCSLLHQILVRPGTVVHEERLHGGPSIVKKYPTRSAIFREERLTN